MKVNAAIQTLWIGEELSDLENLCISSYIKNGYDFHLYAYDEISNVPEAKDTPRISSISDLVTG